MGKKDTNARTNLPIPPLKREGLQADWKTKCWGMLISLEVRTEDEDREKEIRRLTTETWSFNISFITVADSSAFSRSSLLQFNPNQLSQARTIK